MARTRKLNLFAICCLLASAWALYLANSAPANADASEASSLPTREFAEAPLPEDLTGEVERLANSLNEATSKLDAALARLDAVQSQPRQVRFSNAERARQMAEIPSPREIDHIDANGRVARILAFDQLIGANGQTLANDVQYKAAYGRRLVFRGPDNQPLAFDAEEVHPGVLAHLGIHLADVLAADQRDQENRRTRAEAANRSRLARLRQAAAANAQPIAREASATPSAPAAGPSTYITFQQPAATPVNNYYPGYSTYAYQYPVYYGRHYHYSRWRPGCQISNGSTSGWNSAPVTRQLPQVQAAMASGFRFNNSFSFNKPRYFSSSR